MPLGAAVTSAVAEVGHWLGEGPQGYRPQSNHECRDRRWRV